MNFSHQSKPVFPINYILLEQVCIKINFTMTLFLNIYAKILLGLIWYVKGYLTINFVIVVYRVENES